MNDEEARQGLHAITPRTAAPSVARPAARVTGVQAAQFGLARQLDGWREQFSPREYAVLLDLHSRWLERELARHERALKRWAA